MRARQIVTDALRRLDKINGVIIMFLNTGGDGKYVRVENNIFRRKAYFLRQQIIGAFANLEFPVCRIGLPVLVKRHDNHRRAVTLAGLRLLQKRRLTLFQGNRIDHWLALNAFQSGLYD